MLKNYRNKQITGENASNKGESLEFHFAGGGEYAPIAIEAESYEEALKIWEKKRIKTKH